MIRLLAFTPVDGWTLVREGKQHWRWSPPYRDEDRRALYEFEATRLVLEQGFTSREESFLSWSALRKALVREIEQSLTGERRKSSLEAWRGVLRRTTAERAWEHCRTLSRWIEDGDCDAAEKALVALLSAREVAESSGLVREVAGLLERVLATREPDMAIPVAGGASAAMAGGHEDAVR